ncbi:MAG: hypothetical protein QF755_03795 [Candidatus Peribacteraceae bacterium]|jgi:outer membrane biosynthesis protein TonB|nr:hypothetical protein [Candidatus Peribacteraceae bacterium]|tara:strand:- start:803 stop:1264 length:462 start_codon:yes stop_codon:yes gene_type:complete
MKKLTSLILSSSLLLTAMPAFASGFTVDGELFANAARAKYRRARLMQIGAEQQEAETPQEEPAEDEAPEAEETEPVEEAPAVEETAPAVEETPVEETTAPKKTPVEVRPSDLQRLQDRTCPRVYRRFSGDATMMERVNERLLDRFGFVCNSLN